MSGQALDLGIEHVAQEDAYGCGVACVAMLTGRPYRDVRDEADAFFDYPHYWSEHGISHVEMDRLLGRAGYFMQMHYQAWYSGDEWPLAPFAPAHYVMVKQASGMPHYVVLLADGSVLDPAAGDTVRRLTDWPEVGHIVGLIRAPDSGGSR